MPFDYRNLGLATPSGRITHWAYSTTDDLADVCKTGYFQHAEMRLGDRIEVSAKGDAQATLAVISPDKGRIRTRVLACYDPLDSLDRLPAKRRPEKKAAPEEEPQQEQPAA
jgi:hypothetical protein